MRNILALTAALSLVGWSAQAQRPADPNEVSHASTIIGRDSGTGFPCYVGTTTTCQVPIGGAGASAPNATTGQTYPTTTSPGSYKDSTTGATDPMIGTAGGGQTVSDPNNAAFQGQTPASGGMVAGTTYTAGRSIFVVATGSGTLNLVLVDGSTLPYPITGAGAYQLPFAVTQIATSSTAPFSYASNLK